MKPLFTLLCALVLVARMHAHDLVLVASGDDSLRIEFGHPGEFEPADLRRLIELNA